LFGTGQETTANHLSMSVLLLLTEERDTWDRLVADPALMPAAVEELLRYVRLVEANLSRVATEDVRLSAGGIPAGATGLPVAPTANRAPEVFAHADRFDIDRPDVGAHIAFGHGAHHCLGAALARLELHAALTGLVTRLPGLRVPVPAETL